MLAALTAIACASCQSSKPTVKLEYVYPTVPAAARVPCAEPTQTGDKTLSASQILSYWGRDRIALRQCESRRAAAVDAAEGKTQ